ncbi:MAG TPA: phage terminase large subunit [Gemmataceae bacterium]|nr:phage terminase large subunit [Gemmataceae bacterium]
MAPDENRQDKYKNTANGERFSTSTTARTAGFDADLIIADDLIDFAERSSRAALDEASDYFLRTLLARLVRLGEDRVVLAGHRISDQDVFARVQETLGDEYCYLILPEEARSLPVNSLGWKDTRAEGELLWPEAYGHEVLKGERKKYRAEYAAVFLQDPRPQEGNLFRPEWFKQYSTQEQVVEDAVQVSYRLGDKTVRASDCWRFATVDLAVSVSDSADWTVCQVWDCWRGHLILVHQLRARLDGTQIIPRLVEIQNEYKPQFMVVESEFTGKFVQDQLREKDVMVRPFRAKDHGSKEIRSIAAQVMMEDGRVWFPTDKGWVADLESELMSFPTAAHDDQVDCLSAAALTAQRYDSHEPEPVILTAEQEREQQEKERQERHLQILEAGSRF